MDGDGEAEVAQRQREIKFGRRLAANDKKTRDKALKKLKAWLRKQSELSDLDNCKLWRGLFYCMWMSDKPLVQEELGGELVRVLCSSHGSCLLMCSYSSLASAF